MRQYQYSQHSANKLKHSPSSTALQASRQHLLRHLQEARERSRRLQESLKGNTTLQTQAAQLPTAGQAPGVVQLSPLHRQFDPAAFVDRKVTTRISVLHHILGGKCSFATSQNPCGVMSLKGMGFRHSNVLRTQCSKQKIVIN